MEGSSDELVYSKNALELFTVANEYCLFMARADTYTKEDIISYLQKICPLIYIKGCLIPEIDPSNPDAAERYVTQEEWESLFNTLRNKFRPQDEFWYVDPVGQDTDNPLKGSLAEHFTDIYQDLMDFVLLYQKDSVVAKENALFSVRKSFIERLGYRLVNGLRILHYFIYGEEDQQETPPAV